MIQFRNAAEEDAPAIAALHADNWKKHYRGLCPDHYLDHEVDAERLNIWTERFSKENPLQHVIVAYNDEYNIIGFVCTFLDFHKDWGAYLDNLHVSTDFHRRGLGKKLMHEAASWVKQQRPKSKIYLHVLEHNESAIKFYDKLAGQKFGPLVEQMPWGGEGNVYDYLWELDQLIMDQ